MTESCRLQQVMSAAWRRPSGFVAAEGARSALSKGIVRETVSLIKFTTGLLILACCLFAGRVFGADVTVVGQANSGGKYSFSMDSLRLDGSAESREFAGILRSDLLNSGWFKEAASEGASSVALRGDVRSSSAFSASVTVSWMAGMRSKSFAVTSSRSSVRDAAHKMSDQVTRAVTGRPGMASSKILFVGRTGIGTDIYMCDADGRRMKRLTSDNKLCLSPVWIPGQNAFMYTSWLTGVSAVYKVNLDTEKRELIAGYPGMNNGAAVSPDGRFMAIILSRSGGVDMYVMDLAAKQLRRLTASRRINESSPSWSPDGRRLVFVDDRSRAPQLYMYANPLQSEASLQFRQTLSSPLVGGLRESVAPDFGPDGVIAFCGRTSRYGIYIVTPASDSRANIPRLISPQDGADYEDPSWAPDGRHIVCTRTENYKRTLVVLDTMGDPLRTLVTADGDWYLPSWSGNFQNN